MSIMLSPGLLKFDFAIPTGLMPETLDAI